MAWTLRDAQAIRVEVFATLDEAMEAAQGPTEPTSVQAYNLKRRMVRPTCPNWLRSGQG